MRDTLTIKAGTESGLEDRGQSVLAEFTPTRREQFVNNSLPNTR